MPNAEKVKERGLSQVNADGSQAIGAFKGFQKLSCATADQRREGDSSQEEQGSQLASGRAVFCAGFHFFPGHHMVSAWKEHGVHI